MFMPIRMPAVDFARAIESQIELTCEFDGAGLATDVTYIRHREDEFRI